MKYHVIAFMALLSLVCTGLSAQTAQLVSLNDNDSFLTMHDHGIRVTDDCGNQHNATLWISAYRTSSGETKHVASLQDNNSMKFSAHYTTVSAKDLGERTNSSTTNSGTRFTIVTKPAVRCCSVEFTLDVSALVSELYDDCDK